MRALIADDEPLARERVRELLRERNDVVVAGEARDGEEALRLIETTSPDLLLLDVQMPGLDGFEVLAKIDGPRMPAVVFITAYDEHAVRAFEVNALDYLVKPFRRARFHEAVDRAVARSRGPLARFVVRSANGIYFVRPEDVTWLESAGNYVCLHTASGEHLVRASLSALEERLDPAHFLRVHRSAIVNLDAIAKLQPHFHGELVITLRDGSRLTSSRTYSPKLRALLV